MTFTKQDAITFLIGLGVALAFVVGGALVQAETVQDDWGKWAARLGVGLLTATGRYLVTYLFEKGFKPQANRKSITEKEALADPFHPPSATTRRVRRK